ncbi:MAG: hypothetical protein K6F33_07735 [Bacteroidales bacterium]|nr:hypothetical protein [Bacteroidales bacterium]
MNPFSTELLNKITSIIVKKFIRSGGVAPEDYDDMIQTLRAKYLAKKEHIESLYKGEAQPQTYMSSVLRMMMLEVLRQSQKSKVDTVDIEKATITEFDRSPSPEQKAIIENEKNHFRRVIATMGKDKAKIMMCLKKITRLRVSDEEFDEYLDGRPDNGARQYLNDDGDVEAANKDIYARLCNITNLVEGSQNKPDAIRIWLGNKIDQIIKRMNSGSSSKYDNDSLAILLELMYA